MTSGRESMSTSRVADTTSQLDPLALSTETTGRFYMLIVAAFVMAWSLAAAWVPTEPLMSIASLESEEPILGDLGETLERSDLDVVAFWRALAARPRAARELSRQFLQFVVSIILVGAFAVIAPLLARVVGVSTLRRHRALPLDRSTHPRLIAELDGLARAAGLTHAPKWLSKAGYCDGLALGTAKEPILLVAGDPRRLERALSIQHRAVILHELGHLVNDDSATRGRARAAWLALAVLAALGPIVAGPLGTPWESMGRYAVRLAASSLVALGIWAGLVRAREHFADARVAQWGYGAALRRRLALSSVGADTRRAASRTWRRWIGRLESWLDFHPSNAARRQILDAPLALFRVAPSLALLTGVLLSLTFGNLWLPLFQLTTVGTSGVMAITMVLGGLPSIILLAALAAVGTAALLPLTYGVVSALGTQLLRAAVGELSERRAGWGYRKLWLPAAGFVAGVELGVWLTPLGASAWRDPAWMLGWLTTFSALVWTWMAQAHALGRLALGSWSSPPAPGRAQLRLRLLLTALLLPVFWPALAARAAIGGAAAAARSTAEQILGQPPSEMAHFLRSTSTMLLSGGLLVTGLVGISVFLTLGRRLRRRRPVCDRCGHRLGQWRTVGVLCPGCERPAAGWLCFETPEAHLGVDLGGAP